MFRGQFLKKPQNSVRTGNFKKGAVAAVPSGAHTSRAVKAAPKAGRQMLGTARCHINHLNNINIRRFDYTIVEGKPVFHIYFYDNLQSWSLDYVDATETSVAPGFTMRSLIPLYEVVNNPVKNGDNNATKNPHLDALQDMFDDIIEAGDFKITDPSNTAFANGATPVDGDNIHTYDCVLHSETRTFITKDILKKEGDETNYLNVNYNIISNQINKGSNCYEDPNTHAKTMRTQDLWIGFYRKINENTNAPEEPTFLKLKITSYIISCLYAGYGTLDNVKTIMNKVTENSNVVVSLAPEQVYISPEGTSPITTIEVCHATDCKPTDVPTGSQMKQMLNVLTTSDTAIDSGYYVNHTPGYTVTAKFEGDDLVELQSRPICVELPELLKWQYNEDYTSKNFIAAMKIEVTLPTGEGKKASIDVCSTSYAKREGEGEVYVPVVNFPKLVLKYPITANDVKGDEGKKVVTKDISDKISSHIAEIDGALISGPIEVENTDGTVKGTLQFLDGVTFKNCTFEDSTTSTDWFWLFNNKFVNCDMKMKIYEGIKDKLQIVGAIEDEEGYFYDDISMPYTSNFTLTSVEDLYAFASVHYYTSSEAPDVIRINFEYTPKSSNANQTIKYVKPADGEDFATSANVYVVYTEVKSGDDTLLGYKANICTKELDKPNEFESHSGANGDWYFEVGTDYYKNLYVGLVESEVAIELQKILEKYQNNTVIENTTAGSVFPYTFTHQLIENSNSWPKKTEILTLIANWKHILEVIPICWRYLGELSDIFTKIAAFENGRMPCIWKDNNEDVGLESVNADNVVEVSFANSDSEGKIEETKGPQYFVYIDPTKDQNTTNDSEVYYWWKDKGTHDTLASNLDAMVYAMNTCMRESATEAYAICEERLYKSANSFMTIWENYYKAGDNGSDITITNTMIDLGEYEIYEEEGVYETFYESTTELTLAGDTHKADVNAFIDYIVSVEEIKKLIYSVSGTTIEYGKTKFATTDVHLYKNPIYAEQTTNEAKANSILEYGQFLSTIQSIRNLMQQSKSTDVILKFTQTSRGTFFEILGAETSSTATTAFKNEIAGFYVSKGYQGEIAGGQERKAPSVPKGRYDRKARRTIAQSYGAAPTPNSSSSESDGSDWRITIVPKLYEGEPLDWTKDNYYTTFLFAQNADNLNIQIDPEFEARNKVIFTKDTTNSTTDEIKRLEQEMIGYFTIEAQQQESGI